MRAKLSDEHFLVLRSLCAMSAQSSASDFLGLPLRFLLWRTLQLETPPFNHVDQYEPKKEDCKHHNSSRLTQSLEGVVFDVVPSQSIVS